MDVCVSVCEERVSAAACRPTVVRLAANSQAGLLSSPLSLFSS
jgi:hypothetical protein